MKVLERMLKFLKRRGTIQRMMLTKNQDKKEMSSSNLDYLKSNYLHIVANKIRTTQVIYHFSTEEILVSKTAVMLVAQ